VSGQPWTKTRVSPSCLPSMIGVSARVMDVSLPATFSCSGGQYASTPAAPETDTIDHVGGVVPAELQAALEELERVRESEARFRKLAERASDLISRTDPSGRCIYVSPSCRDLLGYEPEEIVGKLALVDLAHPDDVPQQQQVLARFVQGKTSNS